MTDNKDKVILHCDCNSFFASVETALNPTYKNVPMAVCGSVEDRHGIVLAKNELAKSFNINTAETVFSAKKKCPQLVIAPPHYEEYSRFSARVNEIYSRYTELIEPFGIDESWLDVTASEKYFGSGMKIAEEIRQSVKKELGITVSVGVSFTKVFAKLGSDYKKPDAITYIGKENFKSVVFPLKVTEMIYVGKKIGMVLNSMGIKTIGELAESNVNLLTSKLGKIGEQLYCCANGIDDTPVIPPLNDTTKSISNGFTFRHNLTGNDEWKIAVDYLSDEIGAKLRKHSQKCATVSVMIKDEHFHIMQRQRGQIPPTSSAREIANTAYKIICDEWNVGKPIRMITVTASNLISESEIKNQFSFFETEEKQRIDKIDKIEKAVDKIRQKYGGESIIHGAIIDSDLGIYKK